MRPPLTVRGPAAAALAATALVLLPGTAAADVTVAASHAASGARDVTITFRVTDDDPAVAVTRLEVFLPTVTWEGGAVPADGYAVFPIDVDRLPDGAGPLRFRVIQTSADGTTVEWSDLLPYGAPAPQHPALVVPYVDAPPALPEVPGHHHGAGTEVLTVTGRSGSGWWTVGLAAVAGALVAAGSVVLGRRQRRRFAALVDRDRRS